MAAFSENNYARSSVTAERQGVPVASRRESTPSYTPFPLSSPCTVKSSPRLRRNAAPQFEEDGKTMGVKLNRVWSTRH